MVDDRCHVGRPVELHCVQGLVVCLHHSMDPHAVGVLPVAVEGKLVRNLVSYLGPESKRREEFVSSGGESEEVWGRRRRERRRSGGEEGELRECMKW